MSDQPLPPGALDALKRPSNAGDRSRIRKLSDFENGVLAVVASHDKDPAELTHKFDLLCPRNGCERDSVELDITKQPLHPDLPALPAPPATAQWWLVAPTVMEFENIGFTNPVQQDAAAPKLKFLICAECDLGPLGWCEAGVDEFWLACSRVGYRLKHLLSC
ncbi:hypothetical protein EDD22DRAFT_880418 [Suillus occidentalis]|nr:hypothetical protein EDD22DRAFT_880418 [Suillus occidentalis]